VEKRRILRQHLLKGFALPLTACHDDSCRAARGVPDKKPQELYRPAPVASAGYRLL